MNEDLQKNSITEQPKNVLGRDFLRHSTAGYYEAQEARRLAQKVAVNRVHTLMDFADVAVVRALHNIDTASPLSTAQVEPADTIQKNTEKKSVRKKLHLRLPRLNVIQVFALAIIFCGAYLTYISVTTNKHIDVQVRALETKKTEQNSTNSGSTADGNVPDETPPPARESVYSYTRPADMPKRLEIDSIDVVAKIIDVGIDKKGNVDVPISLHDVGWFMGSTNPIASPGSSVMVGHVGGTKYSGVFANLKKLKTGGIIRVVMGNESRLEYKITSVESVPVGSMHMADYLNYASQKKDTLHLITCTGTFNNSSLTYENRLVVTAERL